MQVCLREVNRNSARTVEALATEGKVKKVLVQEISRIARRNSVVHQFVEMLEEHGVSLYWHAQGTETFLPNGKRNPAAGIMLALLAEMARSEFETLRERIKSGLAQAGRQTRQAEGNDYRPRNLPSEAQRYRSATESRTHSVRNTAKITGKGVSTVQRVKLALAGWMMRTRTAMFAPSPTNHVFRLDLSS